MAPRIVLVAHAATSATRRAAFRLDEAIERPASVIAPCRCPGRAVSWPARNCGAGKRRQRWAGTAKVDDGFADLDAGRWSGADLGELLAAEPESVMAWMTDPVPRPHGGESLDGPGDPGRALDTVDGAYLAGWPLGAGRRHRW